MSVPFRFGAPWYVSLAWLPAWLLLAPILAFGVPAAAKFLNRFDKENRFTVGYHVTAVQNPLTSLADDVAATRRVLQRQNGGVILVGHSWAGAVVTEAGNADNVKGLVYLSALVPDAGESVADMLGRLDAPMDGMKPDGDGWIWLDDPSAYREVMAGDVPATQARLLAAAQQPIAARAFGDKLTQAAWRAKPSWYLVTENDKALPPKVQRLLAQHIGARTVVVKSSHMSLVSHAREVAALIERAARSAGQ